MPVSVDLLADQIMGSAPAIDGVTYSGGEPFSQAQGLSALSARLRAERSDISLMSFSGFTHQWILRWGTTAQRELLGQLDILVDGPYVAARHASLRWRGSSNQQLHLLSARHDLREFGPDQSVGVEIEVRPDASVGFVGVPPAAGFREAVAASVNDAGLALR